MSITVNILWQSGPVSGTIEVAHGTLVGDAAFNAISRLPVTITDEQVAEGAFQTRVTVRTEQPFTFFLRDVNADYPIFIPEYGVAVTAGDDPRDYAQIAEDIRKRGLASVLQGYEQSPETNYEEAAARTRDLKCQTWLGLSRDMRTFEIDANRSTGQWGWVIPRYHSPALPAPETEGQTVRYEFTFGRGAACQFDTTRRLEDGVLPILHGTGVDGDITYHLTAFATLERSPLTAENLRGTHYLVADGHTYGHMLTPEQQAEFDALKPVEMAWDEEVVLCLRSEAVNTAPVPRYAWCRAPITPGADAFDGERGFVKYASGSVCCVTRVNGKPMPQREMAVLVPPGGSATFVFFITHSPIPPERAEALAEVDFDARHAECRAFWQAKLARAARLNLPERRIHEMALAGLLHCDLVALGKEPDGPLAATIGWYAPIGTESSPIIQYFDAMGWHDIARRSLEYFLAKQHNDGFMQNFGGYMVETGAALWTMSEHYRYTRDDAWVAQWKDRLLLSCDYLIAWRRRNMLESLRGRGYGMIDGKVGDPEDETHYFMNSGYACAGLAGVAEMLRALDSAKSAELEAEAEAMKADIRAALLDCIARSPVVPLRNGAWVPALPPWAEGTGSLSLFAEGGLVYTHGGFPCRDSAVGPLWLVYNGIVDADEPLAALLLNYHCELFTMQDVAFSQPFYSRHDYAHIKRGEVKAFLQTYYHGFAGLADRETYTFWEHYFHASPHKTHEEAWFLMQTRWMLYLEQGDTLLVLPGVPRAWLEHGKTVEFKEMASYFGPVSAKVESQVDYGQITAVVECGGARKPATLELRLPHPNGLKATQVTGGEYDLATETVRIAPFTGKAEVTLQFGARTSESARI
ncbi:MAG: hypothetical protein ACYC6A_18875 [Armatimonadota bacterium]